MPLTHAQVQAFFTDMAQMVIPAATVAELANEDIGNVDDVKDSSRKKHM